LRQELELGHKVSYAAYSTLVSTKTRIFKFLRPSSHKSKRWLRQAQSRMVLEMTSAHGSILDEMLEPLSRSLGLETARALVSLRPTARAEARVQELAEKCNEGQLSPEEREEYETYVEASTLIGILQAKARRVLREAGARD
jgi:hypothetical protein